jgi:RHH-type proline utilization regulon transcriptional repressor/proline dehydrogenase/delta 1-pyrroline-5-carboxylate dehydrogenase
MNRAFESRVRRTGQRLFQLIGDEVPPLFHKASWAGRVIAQCAKDEGFKAEFIRFMDVLPSLQQAETVAEHLVEYFGRPRQRVPPHLKLRYTSISPACLRGAEFVSREIQEMMKAFIAAATPEEALPVLGGLRERGMAFSADVLGEAVVSKAEADVHAGRYLDLMESLGQAQSGWPSLGDSEGSLDWGFAPKVNLSIKVSSLDSQMSPRAFDRSISRAKERLRPLLREAMKIGAHVCLDMEHYDLKNLTLALYRSLMEEREFRGYPHSGTVFQAYLRESETDLRDLLSWARKRRHPMTIRLVKGAYWDAEGVHASQRNWPVPFFMNKRETDARFEQLAFLLLENGEWVRLACASHNIRSIAWVAETAKALKAPPEGVEYQVLYGMAEPVQKALVKAGLPVRVYAPLGEMIPGMAYLVRRLLEITSKESFLLKRFGEGVAEGEQLKNPGSVNPPGLSARDRQEGTEKGAFHNEPQRDWSLEKNRRSFVKALGKVKGRFPMTVPVVINGEALTTVREILSRNPNDATEVVGVVSGAGTEEAESAILSAAAAFPKWRDRDPAGRAEILLYTAAAARRMRDELAAIQVYEVGKTWDEADADVCEGIDFLEYYAREMLRLALPRQMGKVPGEKSVLFYEPRGVAVVIAPWNFPFAISMGMISAALVTGNTVVYKPSSNSCVTGTKIHSLFAKAGLPREVLHFLPGSGAEIGDFLVTHPRVALIAFTGSMKVGLRILALAGETLEGSVQVKNVVAEMGGKNAILVDADADLDEVVAHVVKSAFGYQGQKCSACSRLIVHESVYDRLADRLKRSAESLVLGPPEDPGSFMGAVIDEAAKEKILGYIEIGKQEGTLLVERAVPVARGHAVPLTVIGDIRREHRLAQEEIFGPVLALMKVRTFREALDVANSTSYALTGAVFSRSPKNLSLAKEEFRVGNLYLNRGCTGALVGRHPFGGFKMSGAGSKTGGPDYLLQFMVPRNVVENTLRRGFAPANPQFPLNARTKKPRGSLGSTYFASRSTEKYLSLSHARGARFSLALKATTSTK